MFKSKSELDKHVGKVLLKCKSITERNKESFKMARLYIEIEEYDSANRLLDDYLSEFTLDSFAWKLKGEVYESHEQDWGNAIRCYSESFNLSQSDPKTLLKIITCYLNLIKSKQNFDAKKAREWIMKAENQFRFDKSVIDLKEKLFDSMIDGACSGEFKDWESFLLKAIKENYLNPDIHLKLIKLYLKNDSINKGLKHIIEIESKSIFNSSPLNWHEKLIEMLEVTLVQADFEKEKNKSTNGKLYLTSILFTLVQRHLLNNLKFNSDQNIKSIKQLFHKLDTTLCDLKSIKNNALFEELTAQFYLTCGLLLLKLDNENQLIVANVCFLKSLVLFKPQQDLSTDLNHFMQQESLQRYAVIGNWFKFIQNRFYSDNQNTFYNEINSFSKSNEQTKLDLLSNYLLSEPLLKNVDSKECLRYLKSHFTLKMNSHENKLDNSIFETADRQSVDIQSTNLNYLVWHTLINMKKGSSDHCEHIFPYFFFHNTNNNARYGVENLNICNLDSLCLVDMKLFLYLASMQKLSKKRNDSGLLLPYWLEDQLSTTSQSDWWFHCFHHLFQSPCERVDSMKQNDLIKILELVRLKSSSIKLQSSQEKFKPNIKICIKLAYFLQYLLDNLISMNPSELKYSPKEKHYYLKKYAMNYWSFVCKQLIKLKQLASLNSEDYADTSSLNGSLNRRKSFTAHNLNDPIAFNDYFDYLNDSIQLEDNKENVKLDENYDDIIQTGMFYLILNYIGQDFDDSVGNETKTVVDDINLNESISLLNLMEKSLSEKAKTETGLFHLQQCKQIGEILVKQRDELLKAEFNEINKKKLDKILLLIEFIKKKISLGFKTDASQRETFAGGLNQSISYSIKELDAFLNEKLNDRSVHEKLIGLSSPKVEKQLEQKKLETSSSELSKSQVEQVAVVVVEEKQVSETSAVPVAPPVAEKVEISPTASSRMLDLIEILNKQKSEHLSMQSQILKEQFDFVKSQQKQINKEVELMGSKRLQKRAQCLNEIRESTRELSMLSDSKIFNAQFNVFYWLFQNQPSFSQYFFNLPNFLGGPFEEKGCSNSNSLANTSWLEESSKTPNATNVSDKTQQIEAEVSTNQTCDSKSSLNKTPKLFLEKPLGDLKFPTNFNMIDKLKKSADSYNKSEEIGEKANEEEAENREENEEEEEYYDGAENETRYETFLSCNSFLNESNNAKSLAELTVLFNQNVFFYFLDKVNNEWIFSGKCNLEIIADASKQLMSYICCDMLNQRSTFRHDINEFFHFDNVKNTKTCCTWWFSNQSNSGLVQFESEDHLNEFKRILSDLKLKHQSNVGASTSQSNGSIWRPTEKIKLAILDRQVGFCINDETNNEYSNCFINVSLAVDLSPQFFLITFSNKDGQILFRHYLNRKCLFETREIMERYQYICKYNLEQNNILINNAMARSDIPASVNSVKIIFSCKPTQSEFLSLFYNN